MTRFGRGFYAPITRMVITPSRPPMIPTNTRVVKKLLNCSRAVSGFFFMALFSMITALIADLFRTVSRATSS